MITLDMGFLKFLLCGGSHQIEEDDQGKESIQSLRKQHTKVFDLLKKYFLGKQLVLSPFKDSR